MTTKADKLTKKDIAGMIDHAILKPELTRKDVLSELIKAHNHNVFSVCVRPTDVKYAEDMLFGLHSNVQVGTVVGFPHGNVPTRVKLTEIAEAINSGATEIDVVLNIGMLKGDFQKETLLELKSLKKAARGRIIKVIFENALLTDEEKIQACRICSAAKVDFVKTSTGFASSGATEHDVKLMSENVSGEVAVKASGGVRDLETLKKLYNAGATRFGTSSVVRIFEEMDNPQFSQSIEEGVAEY